MVLVLQMHKAQKRPAKLNDRNKITDETLSNQRRHLQKMRFSFSKSCYRRNVSDGL